MNMLTFIFDTKSKIPVYHQLYAYIKDEIELGKIPCDTKLPSKRKLSSYLNLSQNTIQTAYDQLIEEGYVISKERKGFFVNQIDHVVKLDAMQELQQADVKESQTDIIYDFTYHGVDLYSFPFTIFRKLSKEVINEYDGELLQTGDSRGNHNLRNSIAQYLHQSRGVNCSKSQIIISSGTEFLIQILIQLFDRASVYGLENPGYEKLNQLFSSNQAQFKSINIDKNGMILEEIIKSQANILCITPAHQFPSGEIMPISRRVQILNWANEKEDRYIIEDDYDSEFKYSGKPIPALQGLDINEKVIYIGAFSKSLSPATRVSYMVLPYHLLQLYTSKLSYLLCPVPIIHQKVLYHFINDGYFERHLNKMRNIYKKKREILVKSIQELKCGMEVLGADAGLHLLLDVNNGMSEAQLIASAMQYGVKVYGISNYYIDKSIISKSPLVLIGYATIHESDIKNAVNLLHAAWF